MNPQVVQELTGLFGVMIPIIAISLGIGVAFWSIYWDHQKKRLQYQERQLMIEKGLAPPPMLPDEKKRTSPEDCLRRGTILLFLGMGFGIGTAVLANFTGDEELVGIVGVTAAIIGSLGLGNLAYYFIATRRKPEEPTRQSLT